LPDELTPVFLDTGYVHALVNKRDEWHKQATQWQEKLAKDRRRLITTQLIVVEIADGLASIKFRAQALEVVRALQSSPLVEIVSLTSDLLAAAIDLYSRRSDKDLGLDGLCLVCCDESAWLIGVFSSR